MEKSTGLVLSSHEDNSDGKGRLAIEALCYIPCVFAGDGVK